MSLDRSLKTSASLARHRNVLTRAERVAKLLEKEKFDMGGGNPLHLPKVGNRKVAVAKAPAKKADGEAAEGAAAPAGGAAKPAAGAAKPAAGAKAAAPAAKAAPKK